jgi:hypothetical protein
VETEGHAGSGVRLSVDASRVAGLGPGLPCIGVTILHSLQATYINWRDRNSNQPRSHENGRSWQLDVDGRLDFDGSR